MRQPLKKFNFYFTKETIEAAAFIVESGSSQFRVLYDVPGCLCEAAFLGLFRHHYHQPFTISSSVIRRESQLHVCFTAISCLFNEEKTAKTR